MSFRTVPLSQTLIAMETENRIGTVANNIYKTELAKDSFWRLDEEDNSDDICKLYDKI